MPHCECSHYCRGSEPFGRPFLWAGWVAPFRASRPPGARSFGPASRAVRALLWYTLGMYAAAHSPRTQRPTRLVHTRADCSTDASRAQVRCIYRVVRPWWPPPTAPAPSAVWAACAERMWRRARPTRGGHEGVSPLAIENRAESSPTAAERVHVCCCALRVRVARRWCRIGWGVVHSHPGADGSVR